MYIVYDRMYGDFPVKSIICIPYIRIIIWFWPTLCISDILGRKLIVKYTVMYGVCIFRCWFGQL
jgi:hypothetical protein